jgi:hypothetical protein
MDVRAADVRDVLAQHHVRYEVGPYYDILELRRAGGPVIAQRIQAGFDVDPYGTLLEKEHLPLFHSDAARIVIGYFEKITQELQLTIGQQCHVEVIAYSDSVVLDTKHDFRPEILLRIRIGHCRGLDHAEGGPEEQALKAIRQKLRELGVREGSE